MIQSLNRWAFGLIASTALTTQVFALGWGHDDCCDPCNQGCWGDVGIGVELLLWQPCIDDLDYAVTSSAAIATGSTVSGKTQFVDHDYEPGVRVTLEFPNAWCDWGLRTSYTYLSDTSRDGVSGAAGTVHSTLMHPGFYLTTTAGMTNASSQHKFTYQTWDLLLTSDYCFCQCHEFKPFFGLEFVSIDRDIAHSVANAGAVTGAFFSGTARWDADYWGIGFKAGSEYAYDFNSCWQFYSKASGTLTAGEVSDSTTFTSSTGDATPGTVTTSVRYKHDECICVPGWHVGLGFRYSDCWCGYDVTASIGYEFLQWLNTPSFRRFDGAAALALPNSMSSSATSTSLAFHGLNLGLGVTF